MSVICCFDKIPIYFQPRFSIAAVILLTEIGEILFLHRSKSVPQPNTRGLPAGKMEKGELPPLGALRELGEETKIVLSGRGMTQMPVMYVRYPMPDDFDFTFFVYMQRVEKKISVVFDYQKHQGYCWIKPERAIEKLPLIGGLDMCLKYYFGIN